MLLPSFIYWKAKVPSKTKTFVRSAVLSRLNSNDLLQRVKATETLVFGCVMCRQSFEHHGSQLRNVD